ncbi:MAG: MoaD/ThiS family protein [Deltaproteobacteria bacterium]|nr:MoaD/ThiS family protein [Deltaproteobacteria bacterium]
MRLHARLYGTLNPSGDEGGSGEGAWIELPEGALVRDLLDRLGIPEDKKAVVVSEGRVLAEDAVLRDRAEVRVFQPIAGG